MAMKNLYFSRRNFLKLSAGSALALSTMGFRSLDEWYAQSPNTALPQFPDAEKMGRVAQGTVDIRMKPSSDAAVTKSIYDDALVVWLKEVVGEAPDGYGPSRWVETPDGYIYAPRLQPVWNKPNQPVQSLPGVPAGAVPGGTGKGMWAEVSVPYVDIIMRQPISSTIYKEKMAQGLPPRIYYSMVVWIDDREVGSDGKVLYRVNERYGNPGDIYWVPAESMRPFTADEISPINPDVTDKRVVVNLTRQTLACYEGNSEVYFCQVSSGAKYDAQGNAVDKWSTPLGDHPISRKLISLHMSGPTTGDWPAVAWTSIFAPGGVAVHSTYWHNYFGVPRSHGCVNCAPDDAKWVWRWTAPHVGLEPGDIDVSSQWPPVGSKIDVVE
jgi:lipoprotein-anchoring transpeptidase ErfK/SrfK